MAVSQDLKNNSSIKNSIGAQTVGGGVNGDSADLKNFESLMCVVDVQTGSNDGAYSFTLEESADDSSWSTVADADLEDASDIPADLDDGSVHNFSVGYTGSKRYVRAVVSEDSAATTAPTVSATFVKGHPRYSQGSPLN